MTQFPYKHGQTEQNQPFALLHIPHCSAFIPPDLRKTILLSDEELTAELLRMTDAYTDELFRCNPEVAEPVIFPISRLIVDPERFLDDAGEPMAKVGMGVIYTKTSDGRVLRRPPSGEERIELIRRYYEPHHSAMEKAVHASLMNWGSCLIIDCHSFPSESLPCDQDQFRHRPDICIGTDPFHTPNWLLDRAVAVAQAHGFLVAVDRPYAGTLVPIPFYKSNRSVWSIMIEVNRALYMNERTGERLPIFGKICHQIQETVKSLSLVAQEASIV